MSLDKTIDQKGGKGLEKEKFIKIPLYGNLFHILVFSQVF